VLWCGAAAKEMNQGTPFELQVGWHRVDPASEPRRTLWYEVCTLEQVPKVVRELGLKRTQKTAVSIFLFELDLLSLCNFKTIMVNQKQTWFSLIQYKISN
jgi:hypothetical protein